MKGNKANEMDTVVDGLAAHICDSLCKHPAKADSQEELEDICVGCELGQYVCNILNTYNRTNTPLTLEKLRTLEGEPVWIEVLDRPDLSRWHFIVRTESLGMIAKDGLGQYECYPHDEEKMAFSGCYFDIEHGHNYGVNWLAYKHKVDN